MAGQSLNMFAVMSICLYAIISLVDEPREVGDRSTNGIPQYVHQHICGLSKLMNIFG